MTFAYPSSLMSLLFSGGNVLHQRRLAYGTHLIRQVYMSEILHFPRQHESLPYCSISKVAIINLKMELIHQFEDRPWLTQPNSALLYFLLAPELLQLVLFLLTRRCFIGHT